MSACSFEPPPDVGIDAPRVDASSEQLDAMTDAPIDARLEPAFDIGYPPEWRFSVSGPISAYILIANTSNNALSLSTFEVQSITDDHPTAEVRVTSPSSHSEEVMPGTMAGQLTGLSEDVLVDSGLFTETNLHSTIDFLTLEIQNAPDGTYDIHAELTVQLDGIDVDLPMTIHYVPGPVVYADPLIGARIQAFR
jgi:hypothetical protein